MTAVMILLDASVKSAVLIAVALVCMVPLRRASASVRHLVWCLTLAGVLLMPVLSIALPRVDVPVLPERHLAGDGIAPLLRPTPVSPAPSSPQQFAAPTEQAAPLPRADISRVRSTRVTVSTDREYTESLVTRTFSRGTVATLLLALWAIGCALLLARLAFGRLGVARLARSARLVNDANLLRLVDQLATSVGVHRSVTLLRSAHECVPMTWGVVRPVILLPASSAGWTHERSAVVLLHELAHVSRGDAATQLVGQLAQAVQWFNPFVWIAARKLREEREHACDDRVIAIGTRPVEYADHLLHLVAAFGTYEGPVAALAMARRSQFEGRVIAILNPRTRRGTVSRVAAAVAIAVALCSVPALAALRATNKGSQILGDIKLPGVRHARARAVWTPTATRPAVHASERIVTQPDRQPEPNPAAHAPRAQEATAAASEPEQQRDTVPGLLEQLVRATPADGDRAHLLIEATKIYSKTPAKLIEVINATSLISSPGDRRTVLSTLMATSSVMPIQRAQLLRVSSGISSVGDRSQILVEYLMHFPIDAITREAFFKTAATINSSGDLRRVLSTAISRANDEQTTSAILQTARVIASPGDRAAVLQQLGGEGAIKGERLRREYIEIAQSIASSSDREQTLAFLLGGESAAAMARASTAASNATGTTTELNVSNTSSSNTRTTISIQAQNYFKTPDGRGIAKLAREGSVTIQEIVPGEHRMLTISGIDNHLTYAFRVNGQDRPFDATARSWFGAIVKQYM